MNVFIKQKQTHRHRKQTYAYQRGKEGGGINQEFGINRYTLLYIKQITNKDLPYNTGNYIQYLVINYNEKDSEKEYIYYINESLLYMRHFYPWTGEQMHT